MDLIKFLFKNYNQELGQKLKWRIFTFPQHISASSSNKGIVAQTAWKEHHPSVLGCIASNQWITNPAEW